ncbi:hypothetical protein Hanom_Chr04g00280761 [Helianthus anomalus]
MKTGGGRKRIYPKISIEPGVENVYTQKFLYENYIYNTTERKVWGVGRPSRPLLSYALVGSCSLLLLPPYLRICHLSSPLDT